MYTGDSVNCEVTSQRRSRNIVHCLRCLKPQNNLPIHLARTCMKNSKPEERKEELQKAKTSCRDWIYNSRTWDYKELCALLPDCSSRDNIVKELLRRGFFIRNQPDVVLEAEAVPDAPAEHPNRRPFDDAPPIRDCQKILSVAKADFLKIHRDLQSGAKLSNMQQTLYRYYCEALLVFRHMQLPGTVEELTDAHWVNRVAQGGRVVITVKREKTSMQFALTREEEAWFQLYYKLIRPENIEKCCKCFFVSSLGKPVHGVSRDMCRLHEMYRLTTRSSQAVRRVAVSAAQTLIAHQQKAVDHYLVCSAGVVQQQDALPQPQDVVDAALLLDSLLGTSSDKSSTAGTSTEEQTLRKDFSAFVARFPVSLEGQPPCKKQRVDSDFPEDRVFYDKWRATQYTQREKYILSHFPLHKPSATKVARLIARQGWTANCPTPEEIMCLWKPAPKRPTTPDEFIIKCVSEQNWTGLAIKDFGAEQGQGVVATQRFSKGDIVCDYHGTVIPAAAGMAMIQGQRDEGQLDLFFFKAGARYLCIDAQTFPCECHPDRDTVGRKINYCSKSPNLEPFHCVLKVNGQEKDVVLFKALQDISVDTELKVHYPKEGLK